MVKSESEPSGDRDVRACVTRIGGAFSGYMLVCGLTYSFTYLIAFGVNVFEFAPIDYYVRAALVGSAGLFAACAMVFTRPYSPPTGTPRKGDDLSSARSEMSMTASSVRRQARRLVYGAVLAGAVGVGLGSATPAWAGKKTCLTGTDPSVASDAAQITAVRAVVEAACPCASYDGSPGKTHGSYTACAGASITGEVGLGHLRPQCTATVRKYYSTSTCGVPASKIVVPCVKKTAAGNVTCSIKPDYKCHGSLGKYTQAACFGFSLCIDAADTDQDGIVGGGDSGASPYHFVDNGDGTITETQVGGLTWEKKDQAGGLHDVNIRYSWAGLCGCSSGSCTGREPPCQPNAAAASACSAATGAALGCAQCSAGTCNVDPTGFGASTTIWDWLVQLNASNFAGHSDWRIPTVGQDGGTTQLETILDTGVSGCGSPPFPACVPPVFDTNCTPGCAVTGCSCTASLGYWSATTYAADPRFEWYVGSSGGKVKLGVSYGYQNATGWARAVR